MFLARSMLRRETFMTTSVHWKSRFSSMPPHAQ
jgi:hypothetical protein